MAAENINNKHVLSTNLRWELHQGQLLSDKPSHQTRDNSSWNSHELLKENKMHNNKLCWQMWPNMFENIQMITTISSSISSCIMVKNCTIYNISQIYPNDHLNLTSTWVSNQLVLNAYISYVTALDNKCKHVVSDLFYVYHVAELIAVHNNKNTTDSFTGMWLIEDGLATLVEYVMWLC